MRDKEQTTMEKERCVYWKYLESQSPMDGQESFVINIVQHINHEHLAIDMLTPYYCDNSYY